ncbi:DMT family transporter [Alicyclobacillus ferrooxydans]|uniref:EamA domain-containing protein n=1 Tax=Alicyclobacillus ferrooxydans TaxID=471514 RepID=A0A0P9EJP8_9BACL|nr:DMT family transporter [Alicyclobacillus ferrooxydans]KPV43214.1 hypothetical protein AN477_13225 [Alicyclobacillus ferrooxydans]
MNIQGQTPRRWTATITLLLVTLVWGATFSLTKGALVHIGVFAYLTARFFTAALVLTVGALLVPSVRRSFTKQTWIAGTFLGTLLFGGFGFQTLGLKTTTPATAGFLTGLSVVIVPLLAYPILKSIPHPRSWIGAVVALVGLGLLTGVDIVSLHVGDLYVLLCSIFLALQIIYTERYTVELNALAVTTVQIAVVTVWCAASLFLPTARFHRPLIPDAFAVHAFSYPIVWIAVIVCALPGTAFAYFAQTFFQKSTSSTETAIIFSMEPVFAAIIGWLSFHNTLSLSGYIGCLLIFVSMWIADPSIRFRRRRPRVPQRDI